MCWLVLLNNTCTAARYVPLNRETASGSPGIEHRRRLEQAKRCQSSLAQRKSTLRFTEHRLSVQSVKNFLESHWSSGKPHARSKDCMCCNKPLVMFCRACHTCAVRRIKAGFIHMVSSLGKWQHVDNVLIKTFWSNWPDWNLAMLYANERLGCF